MNKMSSSSIMEDIKAYKQLAREEKHLSTIIPSAKAYIKKYAQLKDDETILESDDKELKELVKEEIVDLKEELENLEQELKVLLLPKDPNDDRNTILEIRSGTGGNEAALFAADLYRMYVMYAEKQNLKMEILSFHENEGTCENGRGVYRHRQSLRRFPE